MKARNELEVQKLHKQGSIFSNISVENKEHYSQFNSEKKKERRNPTLYLLLLPAVVTM